MVKISVMVEVKCSSDDQVKHVITQLEKQGFEWDQDYGIVPISNTSYIISGLVEEERIGDLENVKVEKVEYVKVWPNPRIEPFR